MTKQLYLSFKAQIADCRLLRSIDADYFCRLIYNQSHPTYAVDWKFSVNCHLHNESWLSTFVLHSNTVTWSYFFHQQHCLPIFQLPTTCPASFNMTKINICCFCWDAICNGGFTIYGNSSLADSDYWCLTQDSWTGLLDEMRLQLDIILLDFLFSRKRYRGQ